MKSVVVYESHWGNTAAIARAIATGLGPEALALATDEATDAVMAEADFVVAGGPVFGLRLPTEGMLSTLGAGDEQPAPDLSHPGLRSWLDRLPAGAGRSASFETALRWSPGGATGAIERGLAKAGYPRVTRGHRFIVTGRHGPLRAGELEAAHDWGVRLRRLAEPSSAAARD